MEFVLVTPAGKPASESTKIRFTVPTHAEFPRDSAQLDLVLFEQTLESFGTYHVEIRKDERVLRRVPLHVSAKTEFGAVAGAQSQFEQPV
ncbi:MAG: hypothetical protein H7Y38_01090 [Armatimonadetes bacterium]|nr:hypothetical protein [Armatimonadota bacterium]